MLRLANESAKSLAEGEEKLKTFGSGEVAVGLDLDNGGEMAATAAELQTARQALQEASGRGRRWPLPCRACCSHLICMLLIAQPSSPAPPAACRRGPWCANAAQQTSRSSTAHCSLLTTPATSSAAARLRQGWNQQQQGHHQKHQRQQKWIMLPPAAALRYGSTWRPSTQPPWAACC